jgi:hypothetical protein
MYTTYWTDHLSTKMYVETEEAQEFLKVSEQFYCVHYYKGSVMKLKFN